DALTHGGAAVRDGAGDGRDASRVGHGKSGRGHTDGDRQADGQQPGAGGDDGSDSDDGDDSDGGDQASTPPVPLPAGETMTAVGDSVMLASAPALQEKFPGITIDAKVSRFVADAPDILRVLADNGTLGRYVIVGLGTNGPVPPG